MTRMKESSASRSCNHPFSCYAVLGPATLVSPLLARAPLYMVLMSCSFGFFEQAEETFVKMDKAL